MTTINATMKPAQYLAAIKRLGLSQVRAGALFGLSPRHSQRIAAGEYPVPPAVAIALQLLLDLPQERREKILQKLLF